jgi:hypothetical protein
LIVHGDRDEVVPSSAVAKLANKLNHQRGISIDYREISGADHLFSSHMLELSAAIEDYLDKALAEPD